MKEDDGAYYLPLFLSPEVYLAPSCDDDDDLRPSHVPARARRVRRIHLFTERVISLLRDASSEQQIRTVPKQEIPDVY